MNNSLLNEKLQKLTLIYIPFLIFAVTFVTVYSLLNWLLVLKFELLQINEMVVEFWIPWLLPMILIPLFLRKRIKLLKFGEKARDPHFGYMMAAAIAVAIPTFIAQGYIKTATGKLSTVSSCTQIDKSHLTKFYKINNIYLDRRFTGVNWFVEVTGKHNENMVFHGFFALPIMSGESDTLKRSFDTWYGIEYKERISNRLDQPEKEKLFQKFQDSSIDKYNQENLYNYQYFDRLGNNDEHKGLLEAVKTTNLFNKSVTPFILKPVHEAFELRNGKKFGWIFKSFAIGGLIWLIMILIPSFDESALKKFLSGKPSKPIEIKMKDIKVFLKALIPNKDSTAFFVLIELNTLVFIIMVIAGLGLITFNSKDLLKWGANFRPYIADGEYWRLLTSMFLHGGLIHLVMNMYALFFVGIFLEPILGSKRFGIFYLVTGIMASIASIWWHEKTVSVGASGAIFGMYGIFLALLLTKLFPNDFKKSFLVSTSIFVGYNLIFGLTGGIDNAAHIGGLISGMIIGFAIYPMLQKEHAHKNKHKTLKEQTE